VALSDTAVTTGTGTATSGAYTTATSFSPAAGNLVLVMVNWMFSSPPVTGSLTCKDSHGNTFTSSVQLENSYNATVA
jgi:hypothetical protein